MVQRYDKKGRQLYYWRVKDVPVYNFETLVCKLSIIVKAPTLGLAYVKMLNHVKTAILNVDYSYNLYFDKNKIEKGKMVM